MKLKPAAHLLLSITLYVTAAVRWTRVMLRTPSRCVAEQARQTVRQMVTSFRAVLEVWTLCNAPLLQAAE